jgi:hypothetical protein
VAIATGCDYDPGNNWANISYSASVTNNCQVPINATIHFFVDATTQSPPPPPGGPGWVQRATTTPVSASWTPGQTQVFMDTFVGIIFPPGGPGVGDQYYRVRMVFDEGNNCVYTFYSDPDGVCTPRFAPPNSAVPGRTGSAAPALFNGLSRHW